jgi:hypothetical protein
MVFYHNNREVTNEKGERNPGHAETTQEKFIFALAEMVKLALNMFSACLGEEGVHT